ncbi:hypothetical protein CF394_10010 [Tetzosporium hominis]|uniref:Uncharacterized protein n=2 Tax=Caryophanaceae TaxID=186818 RepID=A0A264W1S9_9BACL|nr:MULTISPECIES: hypothetical protein [Planococcaceae]OZS77542.1 hypothetical protein CF394_10010 [Tetzosporium hominis]PJK16676.1 hypothetical protein CQS04_05835 [Chryseomicrobium excrementi]
MGRETLERQLTELKQKEVKSYAGAMQRHQQVKALEAKLHYLELGEEISRERVDKAIEEITALEQEIARLSRSIEEKKQDLHFYLFGPSVKRLF